MKKVLSFLWGAMTASFYFLAVYVNAVFAVFAVASTVFAVLAFITYLIKNWDDI